jgi:uracil-DNA glycosylase family 4
VKRQARSPIAVAAAPPEQLAASPLEQHVGSPLEQLAAEVVACERCARLRSWCTRVALEKKREFRDATYWGRPVPGFGDPRARVLIVGLAPGAHGSNRTGRPFTGDASGVWLYEALHRFGFSSQPHSTDRDDGLTLSDCYITAAGRCAPPANKPTPDELATCRPFLQREIELLDRVRVVVALGSIGHEQWLRASGWWTRLAPRDRPAFAHGAESKLADGITLIASYHPSRQNTNTGRLTRTMWHDVFRRAREIVGAVA